MRNYGDFRQCVIPIPITCILQGTPCDTGIPYTFYGENICSVGPPVVTTLKRKFGQFLFGSHTGPEKQAANPEIGVILSSIFYCNSTRNVGKCQALSTICDF